MFNFLNTSILFAAAAALVPLIIHLFSKRKVTVVEFSSVRHLKAMQKRQVRKLKIRQLLLLLLRMLIIFVAVLAFARPTTEGGSLGSHASVSAVILFDNSISMNRFVTNGQLFDIAKKRTQELIESFEESDKILLLAITGENKVLEFQSKAVAKEKLQQLSVDYSNSSLDKSLLAVSQLFSQTGNLNKELYIVSDLQRSTLPDSASLAELDATLFFVELPLEENDNVSITSIDLGSQLILPGHDFIISADVFNQGQNNQSDLIASLIIDGNRVAQTNFNIDAASEKTINFSRSVSSTGFHSGYVEITDDKFQIDNRFYFSFKIPDQFNLLIIDGDNTGELIKLALSPADDIKQYWSVKMASASELSSISFWDYDVIFLSGAPKLSTGHLQRLKSFLSQGRSLFLTYDGKTDIEFFNANYSEISDVTYDEAAQLDFSKAGYYTFSEYDLHHPLFSFYTFTDNKLPEIRFFTLPKMHHSTASKELLTFTGNRPALVSYNYKSGQVLTFTGPLSPTYSDLSAHAFFVPFVSRIAEFLASDFSSFDVSLYNGMPVQRELSDKISFHESVTLLTPDSISYDLVPEDNNGTLSLYVQPVELPGQYSLYYNQKKIDQFSLNVSPQESDLTSSEKEQFVKSFGMSSYTLLPFDATPKAFLAELRYGNELWQLFIWLALLLLAIEMILSRSAKDSEE